MLNVEVSAGLHSSFCGSSVRFLIFSDSSLTTPQSYPFLSSLTLTVPEVQL